MTAPPTVARGVVVSATSQVAAKVVHLALNVVSTLAVVRYLGPDDYGVFVLVLTVTMLVGLVADFGLPKLAVREIVRQDMDENAVLGTTIVLRLVLAIGAMGLTQVVLLAMAQPAVSHVAAGVASALYLTEAVLGAIVVAFQVRLVQQYEAFIRTGAELIETALVLVLIAIGVDLVWLFVPPIVGGLCGAVVAVILARRRYEMRVRFTRALVRPLMIAALPIGPAVLLGVAYRKLDTVALGVLRPTRDVGLYGAAYQPIEYLFLTTALLMNVTFPLLSKAFADGDKERFGRLYRSGTEALVIVTLLAPIVLAFTARPLLSIAFGASYAEAERPLQLLTVTLVLFSVSVWQSLALLVGGYQAVTLRYNAIAVVVAAVLCAAGVALLGPTGAALAMIGTAAYVATASTRAVARRMDVHLQARRLARIGLALVIAVGIGSALQAGGAAWYACGLVAMLTFAAAVGRLGSHRSFVDAVR